MAEQARVAHPPAQAPGAARWALHVLLAAVGWAGFVWLWLLVAQRPWESQRLVWLVLGSFLLAPLVTALWVWHNRAIHRRKGERRAVPAPRNGMYRRDWAGRKVRADWAALAVSPVVTIQIDADGCKQYLGVGSSRPLRAASVAPARPPARGADGFEHTRLDPAPLA